MAVKPADTPIKRLILMGVAAVVLGVILWWGVTRLWAPQAYEFAGNIESVGSVAVTVRGQFTNIGTQRPFPGDAIVVNAGVTPETRIVRESFHIPPPEELESTGGMFKPDELPMELTVVDLAILKEDAELVTASIIVKSDSNVFGKTEFTAREIVYRVPIFTDR